MLSNISTRLLLMGNDVHFSTFKSSGVPYIMVARRGRMSIGKNFRMNNGLRANPIGCPQKCTFFVYTDCKITIGDK